MIAKKFDSLSSGLQQNCLNLFMNPIVATGIVSAGKNLIENLVSPSSKTIPPAGKFDTELRKAEFSQEIPEAVPKRY